MRDAPDDKDMAAWLDVLSRLIDLPIPAAYREGVLANLSVVALHMERLGNLALDDHTEPAPVYRA